MTAPTTPAASPTVAVPPPTLKNFIDDFLTASGDKITAGDEAALEQVAQIEGPNLRYNPFNTVQTEPGSTSFNSAGVQQYADFGSGVAASVALFSDPAAKAAGIPQALASGNQAAVNAAFHKFYESWGSNVNFASVKGADPNQLVGAKGAFFDAGTTTTGSYAGPGSGVVNGIESSAQAAEDAAGVLTSAYSWLTNTSNLIRVGIFVLGSIILIIGIAKLSGSGLSLPSSSGGSDSGEPATPASVDDATEGLSGPVTDQAPASPQASSKPNVYGAQHRAKSSPVRHASVGRVAEDAPELAAA